MPYTTVTLATLRTEFKTKIDGVPFFSDAEILLGFNEGLRLWNMLTGMWKKTLTLLTVVDQHKYDLPAPMLQGMRIVFQGYPALAKTSIHTLSTLRPGWRAEHTGSGGAVPTVPKFWAPAGLRRLVIWPADHVGGSALLVNGVAATPVLAADSDTIDLGSHEHGALLAYTLHYTAFKCAGSIFSRSLKHYQSFISAAAAQNTRLRASALFLRIMRADFEKQSIPMILRPKEIDYPTIPKSQDNPYVKERTGNSNKQNQQSQENS